MADKCSDALEPIDFLKVSHHGSHHGTPEHLLDRLLPTGRRDDRPPSLVSTQSKVYGTQDPVPDEDLMRTAQATVPETPQYGRAIRLVGRGQTVEH